LGVWTVAAVLGCAARAAVAAETVASPDGRVTAEVEVAGGEARYRILVGGKEALTASKLGVVREDEDFSKGLQLVGTTAPEGVEDRYELPTSKRRVSHYQATRRVFHLASAGGKKMDVTFQVSNDGVAFRYFFPDEGGGLRKIKEEVTSFHVLPGTKAWLQPMSAAKSGWARTNPSYEEYYQREIDAGTPSPQGAGWVYPALFRSGGAAGGEGSAGTWLLVTEGSLDRNYCGTRLRSASPGGEYSVGFPDPRETMNGGPVTPEARGAWQTPWRIIVVGGLKTIVESTLGTDLAEKPRVQVGGEAKPGKASWSWPLLGDGRTNYETQKRFIDYAADMHWSYCLIDALWDKQIGYDKVKELADYAAGKNVGVLVWYNSAGDWNDAPQTPRNLMLTHESRVKEFGRLKEMGVKGIKVDFFGGDGQAVINYYQDILEDAAPYGLLVNFHGATLPRGWNRTFPHLMTMEAVKGLEFMTFEQRNADEGPTHSAMVPFARNVFDPMDFTPVAMDRLNARVRRRTSSAFELALSVVFTSGIQHYAEIPEGMAKQPAYVREFLKAVPAAWEDVAFIDGYPGKYVVVARKAEGKWWVAGVNAEEEVRAVRFDPKALGMEGAVTVIEDGEGAAFAEREVKAGEAVEVKMKAKGGFVGVGK
jgi:hypothetical protein